MERHSVNLPSAARGCAALALAFLLAACGDDPASPEDSFEVIEEVEFDPSLGIDLDAMEKTNTGIYYEDLVEGDGLQVLWGDLVEVRYTGWLRTGFEFDSGQFEFVMGDGQVISGFEQGIFLMREGGVRKIVIPPALAYGAQSSANIPAGSILIFEVEVLDTDPGGP